MKIQTDYLKLIETLSAKLKKAKEEAVNCGVDIYNQQNYYDCYLVFKEMGNIKDAAKCLLYYKIANDHNRRVATLKSQIQKWTHHCFKTESGKGLEINKDYIESYLTCGTAKGNFIAQNIDKDLMEQIAEEILKTDSEENPCAVVVFNKDDQRLLDKIFAKTEDNVIKKKIINKYVAHKVAITLVNSCNINPKLINTSTENLALAEKACKEHDFNTFKKSYRSFTSLENVLNFNKYNLDYVFYIADIDNDVASAVNSFLTTDEYKNVKLFVSSKTPISYVDANNNYVRQDVDYVDISEIFDEVRQGEVSYAKTK